MEGLVDSTDSGGYTKGEANAVISNSFRLSQEIEREMASEELYDKGSCLLTCEIVYFDSRDGVISSVNFSFSPVTAVSIFNMSAISSVKQHTNFLEKCVKHCTANRKS